jgi:multicomponent Na+:H+ antiporter subunit D
MFMIDMHPSLLLVAGALLIFILPVRWRYIGLLGGPILAMLAVFSLQAGTTWSHSFLGYELQVLKVDAQSRIFGMVFSVVALLGAIYALHVKTRGEHVAALLYVAGSLGVVFAGDWLTLFFCWELMAAASVFLIWYRGTRRSLAAGFRYALVHFLGGNLLLGGVLLLMSQGDIAITALTGTGGPAYWLILIGVGINAAIVPLHAWLTDAYPEGTVSGSVFLSAFTTKVAVYVLICVFPGTELLIWAGVLMALYGVVYAILENDARRLLSYSIISQVGFMVAAVGIGTELALNGATAHAFGNILYKPLLFMGAGAVIYATGRSRLNELGGLARAIPLVVVFYMVGALAISGMPLFNGFVNKSIVVYSAGAAGLPWIWIILQLASVGTFLYAGLKLPYLMFIGDDKGRGLEPPKLEKIPTNMYVAMGGGAFLCILFGISPGLLYAELPYPLAYDPYTSIKIVTTIQLLAVVAVGFWLFRGKLTGESTVSLDVDWFYRKPAATLLGRLLENMRGVKGSVETRGAAFFRSAAPYVRNPFLVPVFLLRNTSYRAARSLEQGGWTAKVDYDADRHRFSTGSSVLVSLVFLGLMAMFVLYASIM